MKVIIIGCGRAGAALARLLSQRGHEITVVDKEPTAFERLGPSFKGRTVTGIGFDQEVLRQAGIERADAFAAVTASDEANVVAARLAKQVYRVPRVAARSYDPRKAEIYRRLGIQTISPVSLGTARLADFLTYSNMETVVSLGSSEVDIVNALIPPALVGYSVGNLTIPGEVHVVAITRKGRTTLPSSSSVFQEGDIVHLAVLATSTDRLKGLLF